VSGEEKMKPAGDYLWLGSVFWVFFSVLMLLVGWQEWHPFHKNLCHLSLKVLFCSKWRKKTEQELANPDSPGNDR